MSVVYFVQAGPDRPIKIGVSRDVEKRVREIQIGSPEIVTLLATIPGDHKVEWLIHRHLHWERVRGEWFKPSDTVMRFIAWAVEHPGDISEKLQATYDQWVAAMREGLGIKPRTSARKQTTSRECGSPSHRHTSSSV